MGQVAANDVHIHNYGGKLQEPPHDARVAMDCPQCARPTWRYSRQCMHCGMYFSDWRSRERRDKVKRLARACIDLLGGKK